MLTLRWRPLAFLSFLAASSVAPACSTDAGESGASTGGAAGAANAASGGWNGGAASGTGGTPAAPGGSSSAGAAMSSSGGASGGTPVVTGGTASGGRGSASAGQANGASAGRVGAGGGSSGAIGSGGAAGDSARGGASGAGNAGAAGVGAAGAGGSAGGSGGGGSGAGGGPPGYDPCPTDGSPCKIMPFGDSITDGFNQDTPGGYRVELFRRAHAATKNVTFVGSGQNGPEMVDGVAFPRQHEGHSGWTIAPAGGRSGISTLVATVMAQHRPHIVLLMIGTNDAIDNYEMAKAPERLGALIDSIYAQLPAVSILVAQPIPGRDDSTKGDDPGLSARIKTFNDAIPAVVKQRADAGKHIHVVDMYTPFAPTKASLLEDQWHPNTAGYVLLGKQWWTALEPLLQH